MRWLTVKEAAEICNLSISGIKKAVARGKYTSIYVDGVGKSGHQLRIALESLPQRAQDKYYNIKTEPAPILQYSGKQREDADYKAWVVVQYRTLGLPVDAFLDKINSEDPTAPPITPSQLFRWNRKYQDNDVSALIDRRGGHNRNTCSIPKEAWDFFYAAYMTQQRRGIKLCYDITKSYYPDIPSVTTFERQVRKIPKLAIDLYRYGQKQFNDHLPYMDRDKTDLDSNDIWFSDHHRVDVFVKSADGTRPVRPWLTTFFDARSNKVISYIVRLEDPDAGVVKKCFRLGAETYGIPKEVYFDNGKDYRSKSFSRDYPMSLVNQLGIGIIHATPYHGAAKTVERFFLTFTNRFSKLFDTYTGKDAKERPECMRVKDSVILKKAPSLPEFIDYLNIYMRQYNATPSRGKDMDGKCPDQVYSDNIRVKEVVSNKNALRLLCGNSDERTVQKNGISYRNNCYFHELLLSHIGERVMITYDPDNMDQIAVFDMNNVAICTAAAKIRTPFRHTTEADYKRAEKEKRQARAATRRHQPGRELSVHELIARDQLLEKRFTETGEPHTIEHITPAAARNAEIIESTSQAARSRRIRKEDSISETLMQIYEKQA